MALGTCFCFRLTDEWLRIFLIFLLSVNCPTMKVYCFVIWTLKRLVNSLVGFVICKF